MKTSLSAYHKRPITGPVDYVDMVKMWPDVDIEAYLDSNDAELDRLERAGDTESVAFLAFRLDVVASVQQERAQARERRDNDPRTQAWTDSKQRRYDRLMDLTSCLRDRWPVERFISELMAVDLSPSGKSLSGRCPFPDHGPISESGRSFHVYPDDGHWHCFGCQRHGDVFDMVGLYFNLTRFSDQVEKLAGATPDLPDRFTQSPQRLPTTRRGQTHRTRLVDGKWIAA